MDFNVLITIPWFKDRKISGVERLEEAGCKVSIIDGGRSLSEDLLIEALPDVQATIASVEPYTERVFANSPALKVVARLGVGHDRIDVEAASRHQVAIAMAFGTNHEAVADHAFALMAGLANRLLPYHRKIASNAWGGELHPSLFGSTVGIVGLGRIGRALARRCLAFGMEVLAFDVVQDQAFAKASSLEFVDLETLLQRADFVSLNAPQRPGDNALIGKAELGLMKESAFLVNTARGGLIDEAALIEALQSGAIAGAGLDVFEVEPLPASSPLRALDNVILTPHCAGVSAHSVELMFQRCIDNVIAIKEGRSPGDDFILNPKVLGAS